MRLSGLSFMLAGLAPFGRAPVNAQYLTDILPQMVLLGIGGGALTDGYHLAFGVGAALVLLVILLAATVLRSERAEQRPGVIENEFSRAEVDDSWAA